MNIRKALHSDLDAILNTSMLCTRHMIDQGIFQWNDEYPSDNRYISDITLEQLWVLEERDCIIGHIVLTTIEDVAYKNVNWITSNDRNLYVHRLAVNPAYQGKGLARQLMDYAEGYARTHHFQSVRLDTFSQNERNQRFYEQRSYKKTDTIYFPNQSEYPFYCYELVLNE